MGVMHTRSSGDGILGQMNEVMGLMLGRVTPDGKFIITDAFPLPVEGTETRVNAGASANEFMVTFTEDCERVGKKEHVCGWYHSHPGYGCWLSGIDVQTQMTYQAHQEPFLSVVIDPIRTVATGKVEIGAFRTYPEGYTPPDEAPSEYQSIPLDKIEDFGVHAKQYYQLGIEIYKNSMDHAILELLWNKYWIDTLASSPLLHNRSFTNKMVQDCVSKLEQIDTAVVSSLGFAWSCTSRKSAKTTILLARCQSMLQRWLANKCRDLQTRSSNLQCSTLANAALALNRLLQWQTLPQPWSN